MAAPTIAGALKVPAPTFIRKLARPNHWGQPSDPLPQRVKTAVECVLRNQTEAEISLYLVANDEDLRRVAIGMNANRDSLHENIAFIAFRAEELTAAGIYPPVKSPGDLKCDHANALHYDATATDAQLEILCTNVMNAGREAARISRGMMKDAEALAHAESCKSVPGIVECGVASCKSV